MSSRLKVHIYIYFFIFCFTQAQASYIRNGEGFIVVYSITDHYSFEVARQLVKLIKEVRKPDGECQVPVILVGNKKDLRRGRSVSKEEARETASEFSCSHYETSALTNKNVQIVFFNMVFQVRFTKKSRQKSQGSSGNNGFLSSVRQLFNHRRGSLQGWWRNLRICYRLGEEWLKRD